MTSCGDKDTRDVVHFLSSFFFVQCQQNMAHAVATDESLGIEYDEQTVCDVCRDVSDI